MKPLLIIIALLSYLGGSTINKQTLWVKCITEKAIVDCRLSEGKQEIYMNGKYIKVKMLDAISHLGEDYILIKENK